MTIRTRNSAGVIEPVVTLTDTQTMTNKTLTTPVISGAVTLTAPVITSPDVTNLQATLAYGTGHADITLSAAEIKASTLICTGTADATGAAIVAPAIAGKRYTVVNQTAQTITIKKTGGAGVDIVTAKSAIVEYVGSDYINYC